MLPDRSDPATDYGLPFSDADPNGVVNSETEQPALLYEAHAVDSAAATMTVPRAIAFVVTYALYDHTAVWGESASVAPTLTHVGTGIYRLTWSAAGYPDLNPTPSRRVTRVPNFRFAHAQLIHTTGNPSVCTRVLWTSNTVEVWFNETAAGTAKDCDFVVFAY